MSVKDLRSDETARRKNSGLEVGTPEGVAEAIRVGKERRSVRFSAAKEQLPATSMKIVENCPPLYQDRLVKAVLGLASRKVCIRAQCEQCVGWEDVRPRVGGCRSFSCALWRFRPYQPKVTP